MGVPDLNDSERARLKIDTATFHFLSHRFAVPQLGSARDDGEHPNISLVGGSASCKARLGRRFRQQCMPPLSAWCAAAQGHPSSREAWALFSHEAPAHRVARRRSRRPQVDQPCGRASPRFAAAAAAVLSHSSEQ
eukprot:4262142-Pyramimonas_sp.AAC.1